MLRPQASHLGLFNTSYHWLWLGVIDTVVADFHPDKLNIGMNSEITLAIPRSTDRDRYDVYDIWYVLMCVFAIFCICRPVQSVPPLQFVDYTYFARSPGIQYGGHINISHLAVYGPTAAAPFAVFDFGASGARQATIAERQNMKSVSIRCMIVVKVLVYVCVCVGVLLCAC